MYFHINIHHIAILINYISGNSLTSYSATALTKATRQKLSTNLMNENPGGYE